MMDDTSISGSLSGSVNMEDPMLGTHIDERYKIECLIGRGGSAAVYQAYDEKVGRRVAVKLPKNADPFAGDSQASFEREATRYIRLQHPNTLRLFDYGQTVNGQMYIVTELLSGMTLKERLDEYAAQGRHGIGLRATLSLLKDVASALSEAHAEGLVHRDLKPSNIFLQSLGGQEVVKVIDFGISKDLQEATLTGSSTLWGTPLYMSPEQSKGSSVDARSDLYTLGVIAFECLTGRPPFQGNTPYAILMQHIDSDPPSLAEAGFAQELPHGFETMLDRLMEKDPEKRTASSDALIAQITEVEEIWASIRLTGTSTNLTAVGGLRRSTWVYGIGALLLSGAAVWQLSSGERVPKRNAEQLPIAAQEVSVDAAMPKTAVATTPVKATETTTAKTATDAPKPESMLPKPLLVEVKAEPDVPDVVLDLQTRPQGARVVLDGKSLGSTPLTVNVPYAEGPRTLQLTKRGFRSTRLELPGKALKFERSIRLKSRQKKLPFKIKAQ